jgi:hypothetical protein
VGNCNNLDDLQNIMLSRRKQTYQTKYCLNLHYEMSRKTKSIETEGRLAVFWGEAWEQGLTTNRLEVCIRRLLKCSEIRRW